MTPSNQTAAEILNIQKAEEITAAVENEKEEIKKEDKTVNKGEVVGIWEGEMRWTTGANEAEQIKSIIIEINADGTAAAVEGIWNANVWKQEGNLIRFYGEDETKGYHEFSLSGNTLTFIKIAGPDQ